MKCETFISQFEKQYANIAWHRDVQPKIDKAIEECVQLVTKLPPPMGLVNNRQSRAVYGVDIMLADNSSGDGSYFKIFH